VFCDALSEAEDEEAAAQGLGVAAGLSFLSSLLPPKLHGLELPPLVAAELLLLASFVEAEDPQLNAIVR